MTSRIVAALLIVLSSTASIYYAFNGVMQPDLASVYNRANMARVHIQLLSLLLGAGGALILLPQTFRWGGALLIVHSVTTIGCFIATKDWKGGMLEFAFLQVPVLILCLGYPSELFD